MTTQNVAQLDPVSRRTHRIAVWSGQLFIVGMLIGWGLLGGFLLPPPSPAMPGLDVAAFLAEGGARLRVGLCLALLGVGGLIPMSAVLADQMRRMEGPRHIWANAQLVCAGLAMWLLSQALIFFAVAAFRPDRNPELIQLIFDTAWLTLVAPVAMVVIWQAAVGAAILSDRNEQTVMPRWVGYLSLWAALLSAPGFLGILFRAGPFTWSGLFVLWIPLGIFLLWWITLTIQLLKNLSVTPAADRAST